MLAINNLRVTWKVRILIGMAIVALGIFAAVAFSTLQAVEINSALYKEIRNDQNLVADTNPPSLNLMEPRLQVYLLINEPSREKRQGMLSDLHQFRRDFDKRFDADVKVLDEGRIKNALTGPVHQTVVEYFDQVDQGLVPLLGRGDKKKVEDFRHNVLVPIAQRHNQAVNELMKLVNERVEGHEKSASATATASEELSATSQQITANSEETSAQAASSPRPAITSTAISKRSPPVPKR
jgi:hypothetical protein